MISDVYGFEKNIKISRRILRTLLIVNYYSFYILQNDKKTLISGFEKYLKNTVSNFLNILSYMNYSLSKYNIKVSFFDSIHFIKCLKKYWGGKKEYDKIIVINICDIFKNIKIVGDISQSDFKNLFNKIIEDKDLNILFNIDDEIFLYKNMFLQFINFCFNENFWEFLCKIENDNFNKEKDFYKKIAEELFNTFESLILEVCKSIPNWEIDRINIIEKIILCSALIEKRIFKTPNTALLNEYIELAKMFCSDKAGKFINGILDFKLKNQ